MIYQQRFTRAIEALKHNNFDSWIIYGRETHILGEPAMLMLLPEEILSRMAIIITSRGDRIALIAALESEEAEATGLFSEIKVYASPDQFENDLTQILRRLMPMIKIAINNSISDPSADGLTYSAYLMLQHCLAEAGFAGELVSATPIMKQVRGRKSDEEVAKIAAAVSEAMSIYDEARPSMRLGLSGRDIQRLFQSIIDRKSLGYSWQKAGNPYVSVGARSSYLCKRPPTDVFIEPGDLINVDLGIRLDGYASDNQRSFYALRPGESSSPYEAQHAWETIQTMNRAVCAAMKTGTNSDELTEIGNQIMLENGYSQGWKGGYGHELGLFAHQGGIKAGRDQFRPELDKTLEENMIFTLEPAILTSCGRLCQEEVVQVRAGGGKMLSTPQSEIWLIRS